MAIYVNFCSADSPEDFEGAIKSNESKYWKEAMDNEIKCLNKNKTWNLIEKLKNKEVLDLKWIYTKKFENNFKARIVVRGFQQKEIVEDILTCSKNANFKNSIILQLSKRFIHGSNGWSKQPF